MRVYVYVDGFNLYYRALKGTAFKWVNLAELPKRVLDPADTVEKVRYFTARVSARSGNSTHLGGNKFFLTLLRRSRISSSFRSLSPKTKKRPLVSTGKFVEIHDTEEKGSDVNLATHLLNDGWHKRYEVALVFSQDTDLIEPIRIVVKELALKVGVVWLDGAAPTGISLRRHHSSDISALPILLRLSFRIPSYFLTALSFTSPPAGKGMPTAAEMERVSRRASEVAGVQDSNKTSDA